jgi:hypothetical protein
MPERTKSKFNVLEKLPEISDDKGNVLIVSRQEIVQENGSKSEHLVISKIKRNSDGTQRGNVKSLFIPVELVNPLLKAIPTLKK